MMKTKKKFLIILISLIAIGGIIYFLPKKSENTNSVEITEYTTYFVEKYNFSIEYPRGYFPMLYLSDPHIPPLENELLATINFSSHSLTETEGRYNNGLSQFPDNYKNINIKVFYTKDGYDFKFEPFQVTYEKSFEEIVEHMKNSIVQNENTSSTTDEILVKDENKPFVSVGDKLGGMTVTGVEPFSSNFSNLSQGNVKIKLTGPIIITGMYQFFMSGMGDSGYCMSDFDEESIAKLPSLSPTNKTTRFCFRNEDVVKTKLGGSGVKTKVTVKIDNFELKRYPTEVVDQADLVDVVSQNKSEYLTYTNDQYAFSIKYPKWTVPDTIYQASSDVFVNCPGIKIGGGAVCPFGVFVEPATNRENFISELLSKKGAHIKINTTDTINFTYVDNEALGIEIKVTTFLGDKYYVSISNITESTVFDWDYDQIISGFKFLNN